MAWKPLQAGNLRTRVRIEAETRSPNGQGGFTTAWTPIGAPVFAEKIPMQGDEVLRETIVNATKKARFVIRFRTDVTPAHRLVEVIAGTVWNIRAVDDPYDMRDRLWLAAESGVPT